MRPGRYPGGTGAGLVLAKGNYFAYAGKPAFTRLIYPAPVPGRLGIHVTLDLAGRMRFGPDVEWVDRYDYAVDPRRGDAFYRTDPQLPAGAAGPLAGGADYAGIRPKLTGPGEPAADFMVDTPGRARPHPARAPVRDRIAGPRRVAVAGRAGGREPRGVMRRAWHRVFRNGSTQPIPPTFCKQPRAK